MNKVVKWSIIAGLILIIVIVGILWLVHQIQFNYSIEEIKEINYTVLLSNNKYGVINKNGDVIIEPKYEIIQIPNPSKPIFICMNDYNNQTKEYKTTVMNDKNQVLFEQYENVQAIPIETNTEATTPYEKSVLKYRKDNKYGLINFEGKEITKPIYDQISSINYKEGILLVRKDEQVGAINIKGTTIIKPEYETISSDNYYNEKSKNKKTGFIVSKKTTDGYRYGYKNENGDKVLDTEYTELERITEIADDNNAYLVAFKNGQAGLLKNKQVILNYEYEDIQYNAMNDIFIIQRNAKQGVVNKEGKIIINPEYDTILFGGIYIDAVKNEQTTVFDLQGKKIETSVISMTKTNNQKYYITIDKNDIYQVTDINGKVLIDNNYTYIEHIRGDYFIVAKDGKNGVIDITGKSVIELAYTSIFQLNDTKLLQAEINDTKTIDLYDENMKKIASMNQANLTTSENYIVLTTKDNFEYYNKEGKKIEAKDIFINNSLFAKKINGKWGFVDKEGNIKVNNVYEMATDFNQYGFAGIKKDGKWGVLKQDGTILQEPTYTLEWDMPSFLGKYYRIQSWYGDARYSDEIKGKNVEDTVE